MPKHKVFVGDYGRSSRYAMKKKAREAPCIIVIPDEDIDDEVNTSSSNCEPSFVDDVTSPPPDPLPDLPPDSPTNSDNINFHEEDTVDFRREEDNGSAASEDFDFNDSDIEFNNSEAGDENQDTDQPLYPGASITLGESLVSILLFVLCNNLTGSVLCDLLSLISLHCLQPNLMKTSVYLFRKHFRNMHHPIVKHYFCSACFSHLQSSESICQTCTVAKGVSYFIEIPILYQLQELFQRRGFYERLQHRFHRTKKDRANLEDIYDGRVYQELSDGNGFLSNQNNISFTWNTDGVSIFKSSNYQIWPFYLSINELPYAERTKTENILLAGLWFGPHKPAPNLFLNPLHSALGEIYAGIKLSVPSKEAPLTVRGMVICGTCDLPAKALFLNMTQFNGKYGCPKCKLKGQYEQRRWTYPFNRDFTLRTDEETREFAYEALRSKVPIYGIKGPSFLSLFVYQFIRTTVVDSMHCIFSGITKQLCMFMFDPTYSDHPASLLKFIDLIDARLSALSPPDFIQRRPRSIAKHLKYWKANELKAWLLYYSIPILHDLMPTDYFEHYCMFVIAIYALHQSSISPETVEYAAKLLTEFVNRFDVLYGAQYMSCNVHQLLHLPDTVRDFGPLWVASCFPYEDMNGKIKKLVHSSRAPELQICSAVSSILGMTTLKHRNLVYGSEAYFYCCQLCSSKRKMKLDHLFEGIYSVGRSRKAVRLPEIVTEALGRANVDGRTFETFSRLRKDNCLYAAQSYSRSVQYNNTCVQFYCNDALLIGIIHTFVRVHNCECLYENACECYAPSYAIIKPCTMSSILPRRQLNHLPEHVIECTYVAEQTVAINVEQLTSVCFCFKIKDSNKLFVALRANATELE